MSVITIGMNIPERCGKCRFATAIDCQVNGKFIKDHTCVSKDCPLKSINGLIKKIQKVSDIEPLIQGNAYYGNRYKKADQLKDEIINIIKEYCEV